MSLSLNFKSHSHSTDLFIVAIRSDSFTADSSVFFCLIQSLFLCRTTQHNRQVLKNRQHARITVSFLSTFKNIYCTRSNTLLFFLFFYFSSCSLSLSLSLSLLPLLFFLFPFFFFLPPCYSPCTLIDSSIALNSLKICINN